MVFMGVTVHRREAEDVQDSLLLDPTIKLKSRMTLMTIAAVLCDGKVIESGRRCNSMVRLISSTFDNWHYTDPKLADISDYMACKHRAIEIVLRQNILASSRPTGKGRSECLVKGDSESKEVKKGLSSSKMYFMINRKKWK
jgi:hypothetical protein